ncbi:unnamed protein product [Rotaria sp. Silwood1]|nr:unnamed protein product [Rotaria sp. Silwood1]
MQQQTTATYGNNNEQPRQLNISNEALTYAVENNLSTLKIECIPLLENCEHAKKFVMIFFKYINKDFRNKCPGNQQPLGFHH